MTFNIHSKHHSHLDHAAEMLDFNHICVNEATDGCEKKAPGVRCDTTVKGIVKDGGPEFDAYVNHTADSVRVSVENMSECPSSTAFNDGVAFNPDLMVTAEAFRTAGLNGPEKTR